MPCFDKKLEASRGDFTTERAAHSGTREVDLVITPIELLEAWQAGTVARIGSGGGVAAEGEGDGEGDGGSGAARPDVLRLASPGDGSSSSSSSGQGEAGALGVASRARRSALIDAAARVACRPSAATQRTGGSECVDLIVYRYIGLTRILLTIDVLARSPYHFVLFDSSHTGPPWDRGATSSASFALPVSTSLTFRCATTRRARRCP